MTDEQRTPDIKVIAHDVAPFVWRWPEGEERFEKVWDLEVAWSSRQYSLRHGLSRRRAYGRDRVRSVTWVGGQPMVEGVEADDYAESRALLSLLRIGGKKLVRTREDVPAGYDSFNFVEFHTEIQAPYSRRCLAVKIVEDNLQAWATHAMLRLLSKRPKPIAARVQQVSPQAVLVAPHASSAAMVRELLSLGGRIGGVRPNGVPELSGKAEVDQFLYGDPFAFLLGAIFDQGMRFGRAWEAPYLLKRRLDRRGVSFSPGTLAERHGDVWAAVQERPKLHRFVNKLPRWVVAAAHRVVDQYGGDASRIWSDRPTARELQRRFDAFDGIGQKKAAMLVEILARELGVEVRDLEGSDIAYDVHVRRVFLRTGLAERDDVKHMIEVARALHPPRPGELDYPAWHVGKKWCHKQDLDCGRCALGEVCPRLVDRAATVSGA